MEAARPAAALPPCNEDRFDHPRNGVCSSRPECSFSLPCGSDLIAPSKRDHVRRLRLGLPRFFPRRRRFPRDATAAAFRFFGTSGVGVTSVCSSMRGEAVDPSCLEFTIVRTSCRCDRFVLSMSTPPHLLQLHPGHNPRGRYARQWGHLHHRHSAHAPKAMKAIVRLQKTAGACSMAGPHTPKTATRSAPYMVRATSNPATRRSGFSTVPDGETASLRSWPKSAEPHDSQKSGMTELPGYLPQDGQRHQTAVSKA